MLLFEVEAMTYAYAPRLTNKESIACVDELGRANKRLKDAHDNIQHEYNTLIEELAREEKVLFDRLEDINKRIDDAAEKYGNVDAADDDILEINAGGKIFIAKRSTLTQHTIGTRFGALFIGRWEKKLQRDSHGRIFLDVNSECFQAIVAYLNELMISSKDNPPDPPCVDNEHKDILWHQLELFGLCAVLGVLAPQSRIITTESEHSELRCWLREYGARHFVICLSLGAGLESREYVVISTSWEGRKSIDNLPS
jgi:hypothetical protein